MKNRSTKAIKLLLITSVLASCNKPKTDQENSLKQQVYMRADSTAQYTNVTKQYQQQHSNGGGIGNTLLWYMAFRHLGGGLGYASNGLNSKSVVGTNTAKANAYGNSSRGGFGKSASKSNVSAAS